MKNFFFFFVRLKQKHESDIAKLRNGYQKAIDAASLSDQVDVDFNAEYVQLNMSGAILFESGKADLTASAKPIVDKIGKILEKYHILIIDDDKRIRELLKQFLNKNGFFVTTSADTSEAKKEISKFLFDLMVIDLMMPNESGIEFLMAIRKNGNKTPAIMLTAMDDIENKTECFENGCDDYLVKPFEPKELILRINNILNRNKQKILDCKFGNYIFDFNRQLLTKNGEIIYLTDIETKILNLLYKNINKPLTREELLFDDLNERSIDVSIARLRKKIEENSKKAKFLRTVRNKGYILTS